MEAIERLLQLPYQTLAILVAGYLSYRLAYTGRDSTHQTLDTLAIALVFAFISQAASALLLAIYLAWKPTIPTHAGALPLWAGYAASVGGIVAALVVAAIWRRVSAHSLPEILRGAGISSSDRNTAAWETVINREDSGPSQITVVKKDGVTLQCERLDDFKKAPFGPMILGQDGSIALYVTDYRDEESGEWEKIDPEHGDWGPELTIITAAEIAEVRIRHAPSLLRRWRRGRRTGKGSGVVGDEDPPAS
ncbi:hypothetical protein [Sulfitobacter delicatus]|uniref:Uncharacterized protein n=1 Tax=Sulfitobacter delicatus TaxID=218672 RepID=A0A1G7XGN5_9RHOB|nr:hypothetical protein [Sulfitobacter delicatus]SDG83243.1 hypothetical protein SAMN04489759_112104 [Sulfitobacter delicatus]